jgi:hypothetical protein
MTEAIRAEIHLPLSRCVVCDHEMDMATCLQNEGAIPRPNDISICIRCGNLAIYDNDLHLRELTEDELDEVRSSEVWKDIVTAVYLIKKRGNTWKPDSPPSS